MRSRTQWWMALCLGLACSLAADTVAKAPADGYTYLYNLSTGFTINPFIYAKLPYDPQKDFVPVATTMRQGLGRG